MDRLQWGLTTLIKRGSGQWYTRGSFINEVRAGMDGVAIGRTAAADDKTTNQSSPFPTLPST